MLSCSLSANRAHPTRSRASLLLVAGLALLLATVLGALGRASAQMGPAAVSVGVITSRTGSAAAQGAAQWLLAADRQTALRTAGGIFGVSVSFQMRDDASDPAVAGRHAEELIDQGVLVLVCCTTPLATRAVAATAEAAGVPLLAPTTFEPPSERPYWAFSLAPDDTDALAAIVADAYRENRHSLALMALSGPIGAAAEGDLRALLAVVGASITHHVAYQPGVQELRPEALQVAASQPGGVVVWGLMNDLLVAHDALRRRGYEGNVYARTALFGPGNPAPPWARLINVRVAVPPAVAPPASPPRVDDVRQPWHGVGGSHGACAAAAHLDAERLAAVPGAGGQAIATAPFLAALDQIDLALEQLIALQIPSSDPAVLRQALRDTLIGRPARCSGAGLIDLRDGDANAVDPGGLAVAVITNRGLAALP